MLRDRLVLGLLTIAGVLFASAALATGTDDGGSARTVEVVMRHSRYSPGAYAFAPGETVRFVVRNEDPIDHEFILGDLEVQLRHETGTEPYHDEIPTEVTVPALSAVTTIVTMPESGPLLLGCHLPGHWDYGMKAPVVIR